MKISEDEAEAESEVELYEMMRREQEKKVAQKISVIEEVKMEEYGGGP